MNEPAINSRSRDPACTPHGQIINNFNNSMENQKKSNSIFIHKISNLMETKYDLKRLLRTGTLLALLFAWMLTGSFVANSQIAPSAIFNMDLTIVGSGTVTVSGYANPIVGPVANSTVGPFADGSLLDITATPATGWTFVGWTDDLVSTVTPNQIQVSGGIVTLTANFKRMLTLGAFTADNKVYDGNTTATVTTWGALVGIQGGDVVNLVTGGYTATFDNKNVGTGKTVTITGLSLAGANAADYALVSPITTTANITTKSLTVAGAIAQNKVYDGTTAATIDITTTPASLVGVVAPDLVTLLTATTGTFNNKNVGIAKPVTTTMSIGGADAANYSITQPALTADITPKELFLNNVVVANKVYDGTTAATVTSWGAATGLIAPDVTNINAGGYVANFVNANVGNGKVVNVTANVAPSNTNYFITLPFTASGNIIAPVYAKFVPGYTAVAPRPTGDVMNVPITTPLTIEFNKTVVDINGDALPLNDLGDFIKLEKWDGANFVLVPFAASRVGSKITLTPAAALEYSSQYRLRFLNIYKSAADGGGQVQYSLDKTTLGAFDETLVGALQIDNQVIFNTMSLATATLPTVTPYGADKAVCGEIKLSFVNPVKYLNGNEITDNPKHKFTLQSGPTGGGPWTDVPAADWSVSIDVPGNPKVFTFNYVPGQLAFNTFYRVRNNVGLDANFGFIDKVTGFTLLGGEFAYNHTQGSDGWWWQTIPTYPLIVDLGAWPISPVFPAIPQPSNVSFNGTPVVSVGAAPGYLLTKAPNFVANVTNPVNPVTATNGEGYHWVNWSRSTNGGTTYGTLATTPPGVLPVEGMNWAGQNFNINGDVVKPTTCAQSIAYKANFAINTYTITTSVIPVAVPAKGTVAGAGVKNHGTTVTLTATPAAGQYLVGWDFSALPASVQATVTQSIPDQTLVGYPGTGANGTITFSIVGPLVHGSTWNVVAQFANFEPRIYAATDPQNAFTGIINATVQFGFPARTGFGQEAPAQPFPPLNFDWESYVYATPVKLEAINADCRYEFVKWVKYVLPVPPATVGTWVDFVPNTTNNPTNFFTTVDNIRVKAVYKLIDDVHVSATANTPGLATVIIFTDHTRTTPLTINDITGRDFTWGTKLYITSYPEPDFYTWKWVDGTGATVVMDGPPVRYEDRSEWEYTVGCNDIDLKAFIDLKEYNVTVKSLLAQGHINTSLPAFNATLGNQGGLGFQFSTVGLDRIGTGNFQRNSTVTFKATAAANFAFSHWETPGGVTVSQANPYIISALHGPVTLIAKFVSTLPPPSTYALTIVNNPVAGGSVNMPSGNVLPGAKTVTATAAPGYTFTGWSATGVTLTVAQQSANPMTFTMPANAVTLTANYALTQYTVTPISRTYLRPATAPYTVVDWGGSVSKTPATGTFTMGQTLSLTAVPNPGFRFVNWMVGTILPGEVLRGVQVSDQTTFTYTVPAVNGNPPMSVYAIFVEIAIPEYPIYSLTTAANPAGFGTVTGAGTFAHGVEVLVTEQVTEAGYEFDSWSANVEVGDYVEMQSNQHVVANYDMIDYTLYVESNNPAFGTVTPAVTMFDISDDPIAVSALPALSTCDYEYEFAGWFTNPALTTPLLDAGGVAVTDADFNFIPYALPYPQTQIYIYAKFVRVVRNYDVTAIVAPVAAGTATINAVAPYICGQDLVISTMPNPGYEFQHWTKDGVLYIDQASFNWVVDGDADFVAVYEAIEYDVTATAQPGGTVAPAAQIKTIGQAVEVSATANTGYAFDGWVATGVTLANTMTNPASFTMPAGDVTLLAKFVKINYNVTATANAGGTVAPASQVKTYGDAVTVTATPNAGYVFNGWVATGVTLADAMVNPASFSMPANDVSLVASFAKIPYTVTVAAAPANGGTISAVNANYFVGDNVSVTATAKPGFEFVNWTATGIVLANNALATQDFVMPAGNVSLTANFQSVNNKLMGNVKYFNQFESGLPFSAGVQVALLDAADVMIGAPVTVGLDGTYEFQNIVPGATYKVKVWEAGATLANTWGWNNWGGVSAADALIINYMAAGNAQVNSFPWIAPVAAPNYTPFSVEVADVNNSGTLTGVDPLTVMRRSINIPGYSPFPTGNTPNFQVAAGEVATMGTKLYPQAPSNVFTPMGVYAAGTTDFYYVGTITGKAGNTVMNIYFVAGGDVNASYVPQGGAKAQPSLSYSNVINANVGEVVNIPVLVDQSVNVNAMNMSLTFNNNVLEVLAVNGYDVVNIDNANGLVNVAWFDVNSKSIAANDKIMVIQARILGDVASYDRLFELNGLNELADATATTIEGVSFTTTAINTSVAGLNDLSDLSSSSYPNPFQSEATIAYTLPETGKVSVVVYNKLGQEVKTLVNEVQVAGAQTVRLTSSDLNGNGAYLYKVTLVGSTKSYSVNGTLILVK